MQDMYIVTTKEFERAMFRVEWVDAPEDETLQQIFINTE